MLEKNPISSEEKIIQERILPDIFTLPDLSKLKPDEYSRFSTYTFPVEYRNEKFYCKIDLTRNPDLDNQHSLPPRSYTCPLQIRVEGHDDNPDDKNPFNSKFAFSTYLMVGEFPHKPKYSDLPATQPFWNITYRMVDEEQRGKGYGELALRIIKEIAEKINHESDLKGAYINIDTSLSSLARLIVDNNWLIEHGLGHLAKKSKTDLKFIPHPADEAEAVKLLQGSAVDLHDLMGTQINDVKFIRRLDS
jgi:hypothetical protein